ncbi:SseB family protein [Microbacterium karelineae]|uniref:SseB family protein n=1 Tax=Microbacterium karelineae TaxID=2654283 RepID=UPI0012E9B7AD|nr:SseB family protein [Microbacterium karelineae]
MGLFSRKKKSGGDDESAEPQREEPQTPDSDAAEPAQSDAPSSSPDVSISFSAFQGVGAPSGPEVGSPADKPAQRPNPADGPQAFTKRPASATPAPEGGRPVPPRELPLAPAAPPNDVETVKGLRDNTLLRDALAALPEKPTPQQLLGVARQLLQGHIFLRVTGDVREQMQEDGKATLSFGVARNGDKNYMLVFSSGRTLRDAVQADGNTQTSAVAQPVPLILGHMIDNDFDGLIVDNASAPHRIVLPREVLERAREQADPTLRVKTALAQPRETDTPKKVASILSERPPLWVAVGPSPQDEKKMGIAEARLANGTRLLQVYSHPLEVVAQGRSERALPFGVEKVAKVLVDHPELGGILIDPAGPLITLTRDELDPVLALADEAGDTGLDTQA